MSHSWKVYISAPAILFFSKLLKATIVRCTVSQHPTVMCAGLNVRRGESHPNIKEKCFAEPEMDKLSGFVKEFSLPVLILRLLLHP